MQTRMQKYIVGNFTNFNPRAIVNTSCRKNNALQKMVSKSIQVTTSDRNLPTACTLLSRFPLKQTCQVPFCRLL